MEDARSLRQYGTAPIAVSSTLLVLPLTSGARRRAGSTYAAAAAVFVHKAADAPSPPELLGKPYKLTPTELRVLLAIVEVGGLPEVAEALGIAASTVKTHLGRLFAKTNTNRQVDLVKLVARIYKSPGQLTREECFVVRIERSEIREQRFKRKNPARSREEGCLKSVPRRGSSNFF